MSTYERMASCGTVADPTTACGESRLPGRAQWRPGRLTSYPTPGKVQSPCEMPGIRVDCNVYPPAIGIGATAALIGSMMANAENSAVASVRSRISASRSPSAEILRICSSVIV